MPRQDAGEAAAPDLPAGSAPAAEAARRRAAAGAGFPAAGFEADADLVDRLGLGFCLSQSLAPVHRAGGAVVLAAGRPAEAMAAAAEIRARLGPFRLAPARPGAVEAAILAVRRGRATDRAHLNLPRKESCRGWSGLRRGRAGLALAGLAAAVLIAPWGMLVLALVWCLVALAALTALKIAAAVALLRARPAGPADAPLLPAGPLPFVSLLVPLLREEEIAARLVRRLSRLTYPRDRLEVCLILEEDDRLTRATLARTVLPPWMRVVEVPVGPVRTKPRALNYALALARGEIVGVYDAEDAPDPGQIECAAAGFARAPPEVVCLQGALDYYNPRQSLVTRLFTLEYAVWFRLMLPGVARLGLVLPLGGTTLFFRRDALERIGGWDAWNVTEDADLGVRLARHGWRTAILPSVTREEATARLLPWVRQRSRWLKGFALTWATHMRSPARLWRDLGPWRFLGVQVMLLGTVTQVLLAPVLWSFWLLALGLPHPVRLPSGAMAGLAGLFLLAEAANLAAAVAAARIAGHRGLARWAPLLHPYAWLATLAAWKAAVELVVAPFYWDKTGHGHSSGAARREAAPADSPAQPG